MQNWRQRGVFRSRRAGAREPAGDIRPRVEGAARARSRCVEAVLDEIAPEFGGEDPLKPLFRQDLNRAREGLLRTSKELAIFGVHVELTEPDAEELEGVWDLVRRGA